MIAGVKLARTPDSCIFTLTAGMAFDIAAMKRAPKFQLNGFQLSEFQVPTYMNGGSIAIRSCFS